MIRYVLAVVLMTALVGVGLLGIERGAVIRSETQVENEILAVEEAVRSLIQNEEPPPPGHDGPRRVVELTLPDDGFTTESVQRLVFEREPGLNVTVVTYQFEGRRAHSVVIEAPIENAKSNTEVLDFGGSTGTHVLVLELHTDKDGTPVIEATAE